MLETIRQKFLDTWLVWSRPRFNPINPLAGRKPAAKVDLYLDGFEPTGNVDLSIKAKPRTFDPVAVEWMMQQLVHVAQGRPNDADLQTVLRQVVYTLAGEPAPIAEEDRGFYEIMALAAAMDRGEKPHA